MLTGGEAGCEVKESESQETETHQNETFYYFKGRREQGITHNDVFVFRIDRWQRHLSVEDFRDTEFTMQSCCGQSWKTQSNNRPIHQTVQFILFALLRHQSKSRSSEGTWICRARVVNPYTGK